MPKEARLRRKNLSRFLLIFLSALLLGSSTITHGAEVIKTPDYSLDVWGRGQMLGIDEWVPHVARSHNRVYLYLEQARLGFDGHLGDYNYYTELALGGEDVTSTSGIALTLLEFSFDVPLSDAAYVRLGQYKVPYGREYLANDGALQFAHRSIDTLGFFLGRDVGLAVATKPQPFSAALGVYTGGSRDIPERYLPESIGVPLFAARIGFDNTGEDAFANRQAGRFDVKQTEKAAYLSAAYMEDTVIGHSTVLNLRPADKNLLINPNWNPYLAKTPFSKTRLFEASLDGVIRVPSENYVLSVEGELNAGVASNSFGTLHMYGGRLQGSAAKKPWEYVVRYAVLIPDRNFASGSTSSFAPGNGPVPITPSGAPIHEVAAAINYHLREYSKLIFQASVLVNVPVIHEAGIGSYVSTEQPDQTTAPISTSGGQSTVTGSIDREVVPELQAMWQISF
jgi:hypothetical protein